MRIFGIFTFTGLGLMLSVVSIDGSFQDFTLVGIGFIGFALNLLLLIIEERRNKIFGAIKRNNMITKIIDSALCSPNFMSPPIVKSNIIGIIIIIIVSSQVNQT